ncbi:MAG: response regulator transcription factor, partial [Pigmentiphaga sp.]
MSNARILVVDDDPDIRELLSAYLGEAGFTADTAASGAQLWDCLGQQPYDLIVLDLMMP